MRRILWFIMLMSAASAVLAQTQPERKHYTAPDGTLYWNKKLPVYVVLSPTTNPTDGVVLKEENVDHVRVYHFDTEGINWIRTRWATDSVTGKALTPQREVMWPVMADGLAPVTKARFLSNGKFVSAGKTYYSGDLRIELDSYDAVSGVEGIFYNTGSGYTAYTAPVTLAAEGNANLRFYATDHVGNAEDANADRNGADFIIDRTAPESELELVGPHVENIVSRKTKIRLNARDGGSGVDKVLYAFNTDDPKMYIGLLDLAPLAPNENSIFYHAEDEVKNAETSHSYPFFLDAEAPSVNYNVDVDLYKSATGLHYVSERSNFSLTATDNKAGVNKVYYAFDNPADRSEYTAPVKGGAAPGFHKLFYLADDRVENVSATRVFNYILDVKKPRINYFAVGPRLLRSDTLFVRSTSKIKILSADDGIGQSGVKNIQYQVDGGETVLYTESFSLPGDGLRNLSITSADNVNNGAEAKQILFLDNTPPEIKEVFGVEKIGTKVVKDQSYTIYPKEVQLFLGATDRYVGTRLVEYAINGGKVNVYTAPIKHLPAGNYTVLIKATDELGNTTSKTIIFAVE